MSTDRRQEARLAIVKLAEILMKQIGPIWNKPVRGELYVRHKPEKITYGEEGIITGCQWTSEYITRPSTFHLGVWKISEFEKTQDYQDILTKLSDIFKLRKESIRQMLSSFLENAISGGMRGNIDLLIDDLEGKPPSWHVTAKMYGVIPESQEIQLSEGVKLRRVKDEDLTFEVPAFRLVGREDILSTPHSILEISLLSSNPNDVQKKIEKVTILLSLFKETCASYERYSMKAESFGQFGGTLSRGRPLSHDPKVVIRNSELDHLSKFIRYFEPRIPDAVIFGEPLDPLEVSLKRYLESIRENLHIEEKLTRAVMGLESLFLENETELRFRLAVRVAQLLGCMNEDSSTVYATVSEAYDYRSSHVHGSVLTADKKLKAKEVLDKIWRYLRKAILLWLVEDVSSEAKKRLFLKQLDKALIDDSQRQNLKSRIEAEKTKLK